MVQCDESLTLGEVFGLNPNAYTDYDVSDLPVSIRVTNRLLKKHQNCCGLAQSNNGFFNEHLRFWA